MENIKSKLLYIMGFFALAISVFIIWHGDTDARNLYLDCSSMERIPQLNCEIENLKRDYQLNAERKRKFETSCTTAKALEKSLTATNQQAAAKRSEVQSLMVEEGKPQGE